MKTEAEKVPFEEEVTKLWHKGNYSIFKIACELNISIPDVMKVMHKHGYFIPKKHYSNSNTD
jgi:hypothetical protein